MAANYIQITFLKSRWLKYVNVKIIKTIQSRLLSAPDSISAFNSSTKSAAFELRGW